MKPQSPENKLVVIYALKGIHRVTEYHIISATTQTSPQSVPTKGYSQQIWNHKLMQQQPYNQMS
jgi:hypothetical protein